MIRGIFLNNNFGDFFSFQTNLGKFFFAKPDFLFYIILSILFLNIIISLLLGMGERKKIKNQTKENRRQQGRRRN